MNRLNYRLDQYPLILAGPILRRTEPDSVTVWVALQEACNVTLRVYSTEAGQGNAVGSLKLEGTRSTIALGKHLHLVAVTAQVVSDRLKSEQIYAYDLSFEKTTGSWYSSSSAGSRTRRTLHDALNSATAPRISISYFDHQLPTFALPPRDMNDLKIVHGSCRKPHGDGQDALAILDHLIEQRASEPNSRPHQLFLTGDQVYSDDIADPFLWMLTHLGDQLLGWEEDLPLAESFRDEVSYVKPSQLQPGQRSNVVEVLGGFTAGIKDQPEKAKSHLLSLGEYCASYLLFWSQVLWLDQFPKGREVCANPKQARCWDKEAIALQGFVRTLWSIRRSLANVPTYMIFDDHDISDDWYLNQSWCLRVLGKPLGKRAVQNGLLAFALFQAWGNTPEQFQCNQPGEMLLTATVRWSASAGQDAQAGSAIARYLGLPAQEAATGLPKFRRDDTVLIFDRDKQALNWHYTVRSHAHEVLVLDTRTWRGYPIGEAAIAPPMLLCPSAFDQQIRQPLKQSDRLSNRLSNSSPTHKATLVVAPTNLIHIQAIDWIHQWNLQRGKVFSNDVGDAWNINKVALAKLLETLFERRERVTVLSGDIHYGFATRLNYWSRQSGSSRSKLTAETSHVLVQLTSSAFKNSEWKTQVVHTKLKSLLPESPQDWAGWNQPPDLLDVQSLPGKARAVRLPGMEQTPVIRRLWGNRGNWDIAWATVVRDAQSQPDWRYRLDWIKRQPAQYAFQRSSISGASATGSGASGTGRTNWLTQIKTLVSLIWRNRWFQEGEEAVGHNNLGLVQFCQFQESERQAVVQDLYWYAPWNSNIVVSSRFYTPLALKNPPPPLPIASTRERSQTRLTSSSTRSKSAPLTGRQL